MLLSIGDGIKWLTQGAIEATGSVADFVTGIFNAITQFFNTCFSIISNIYENIVEFVEMIANNDTMITGIISSLPNWIKGVVLASISVSIILQLVGREQ